MGTPRRGGEIKRKSRGEIRGIRREMDLAGVVGEHVGAELADLGGRRGEELEELEGVEVRHELVAAGGEDENLYLSF